jgi:hypothetical protein
MFALDDTFLSEIFYVIQTDFYMKGIVYFTGVILFFEILRSQISEVDILQLIPGIYFLLFFVSFLLLIFSSDLLFRLPIEIDNLKSYGTKVTSKVEMNILLKISFLLFFSLLIAVLNTVIPLSLDSFNSSGEKTLENTWSLDEVLSIEIILGVILIIISQIPLFFIINFNTQKVIAILSQFWKILVFAITLIAGLLTPTLDGYTQISFALSSFSFYLFIVNFLQKRMLLKLNVFLPFGS